MGEREMPKVEKKWRRESVHTSPETTYTGKYKIVLTQVQETSPNFPEAIRWQGTNKTLFQAADSRDSIRDKAMRALAAERKRSGFHYEVAAIFRQGIVGGVLKFWEPVGVVDLSDWTDHKLTGNI